MKIELLASLFAATLASATMADVTVSFPGPQNLTGSSGFTVTSPQISGTLTGIIFHFDYSNSGGGSWAADMEATVGNYYWGGYDVTNLNGATIDCGDSGAATDGTTVSFTSAVLSHIAPPTFTNQTILVGYGNGYSGGSCTMTNVTVTLVGVVPGTDPYPPSVTGSSTGTGGPGTPRLLKATVMPGGNPASAITSVTSNLTTIGGPALANFHDDGLSGDVTSGDGIYSYQLAAVSGPGTVSVTATDELGRTGSGNITVNVIIPPNPTLGPDVVTYELTEMQKWGTNTTVSNGNPIGSITAYSVGTTSSNLGDYPVLWVDGSPSYAPDFDNTHQPAISENMYRLKTYGTAPNTYSRFEQLGQSWLKHGFVSTNSGGGPGACVANTQVWRPSLQNYQNFNGDALGINCLDTYGSGLNGSQGNLGPKNIVNATTGFSTYVQGGGTGDSTVSERLQVPTTDVTGQPAGTRFFVDCYYITQDDSQFVRPGQTVATNNLNNASWREITASSINSAPNFAGPTQRYNPGIYAWKVADPTVTQVNADHDDYPNPGTGFKDPDGNPSFPGTFIRSRYIVSAKATSLGGGLYRYEYAVYNHNSDRSARTFSIPMPVGATVTDITFHAPMWHSGEPYSNTPWTNTRSVSALTFATQTFAQNANANALRWGNMFNFGFTTDVAPTTGAATLALFKAGTAGAPNSLDANAVPIPTVPVHCGAADVGMQGGIAGQDNILDNNDFVAYINFFFASDGRADFGTQGGNPGQDGLFDNNDFVVYIDAFFAGCP